MSLKTIKFQSNSDLLKGIKLLAGATPLVLIDGVTYAIPTEGIDKLNKCSIRFEYVNGKSNSKMLIDKLRVALLNG